MGLFSARRVTACVLAMQDVTHHTDPDLLLAIRAADDRSEPAFREVYRRYARRLFLYAAKVTGSQQSARDIVQDVFLKFLQKVREGEVVDSTAAYLMTINRNLCLNHKRDSRLEYMEPDVLPEIPVESDHDAEEIRRHLGLALNALPEQYREPLMMQVYGGLSYAEICEATGESLPTIRHRISRAKQRLRDILIPLFAQ